MSAILLSLLLFPALGFAIAAASFHLGRPLVEREYKAQGLQMVDGCNLAAVQSAQFDIYTLNDRLAELTNSPNANTTQIAQLRNALAIAAEKARTLNDDCSKRGHCGNLPWKTNWNTIKQVLVASEDRSHQ